jgi:hypothetical protein
MVRSRKYTSIGVTLIELLVVLSIITIVLGMSVSIFRSFGEAQTLEVAASGVSTTVRAARNWSISSGMPSRVLVDPDRRRVSAFGFKTVAAWDFEDLDGIAEGSPLESGRSVLGAFRETAQVTGHIEVCKGSIGAAALFVDDGAAMQARYLPRYNLKRGLSAEAWVRFWQPPWQPEDGVEPHGGYSDPRREMRLAVIGIPGSFEMGLLADGAAYLEIGDPDGAIDGLFFRAQTEGALVFPDRWVHLRVTFDGINVVIEIDGVEHYWIPDGFEMVDPQDWPITPTEVPTGDGDLWISHPNRFFLGAIDQVILRAATEPVTIELPVDIELLGPPQLLHLDGRGALDPLKHDFPAVIHIAEVGDFVEVEATDSTAVVGESFRDQLTRKRREKEEQDAAIEEAFGSPIGDLMAFLETWQHGHEELDAVIESAIRLPMTPGIHVGIGEVDGVSVLRLHNVVIDLTGAIRG